MSLSESTPVSHPEMLFPIYKEVANDVMGSFIPDDNYLFELQLVAEQGILKEDNPVIQNVWDANDIDSPFTQGVLIMHRMLREQAHLTGGRLPIFKTGFGEALKLDRRRRLSLVADACNRTYRDVEDWNKSTRIDWFVANEEALLLATTRHLARRDPLLENLGAGIISGYYLFKDGLRLPHMYS
jgi:hypothetical protein